MRKQKKKNMIYQVTNRLELPRDLMLGESIVTVTGRSDLTIENYKGILEYRTDKIRLSLKHGQIEIFGKALKIEYYTNEDMRITGCIDRVEYGM
jgi:sporulation protein YqfC